MFQSFERFGVYNSSSNAFFPELQKAKIRWLLRARKMSTAESNQQFLLWVSNATMNRFQNWAICLSLNEPIRLKSAECILYFETISSFVHNISLFKHFYKSRLGFVSDWLHAVLPLQALSKYKNRCEWSWGGLTEAWLLKSATSEPQLILNYTYL